MKYVIICFIILFSSVKGHAKTYVQDKNEILYGYDDGYPCVNIMLQMYNYKHVSK